MPTHRIKLVFVGPVLEQQTNALDLTLDGGQVQGGVLSVGLGVDVGLVRHQELHKLLVPVAGGVVERRVVLLSSEVDANPCVDQCLDLKSSGAGGREGRCKGQVPKSSARAVPWATCMCKAANTDPPSSGSTCTCVCKAPRPEVTRRCMLCMREQDPSSMPSHEEAGEQVDEGAEGYRGHVASERGRHDETLRSDLLFGDVLLFPVSMRPITGG